MDLLKTLLTKILYLIPFLIVLMFVFLVVKFTLNTLGLTPVIKEYKNKDWLPAPGSYGTLTPAPTPTDTPTNPTMEELNPHLLPASASYNGEDVIYTQANTYVRDIRIGDNNTITSYTTISGTARAPFFENGKIYILLVNSANQVVGSTIGRALDIPNRPQFVPWEAKFGVIAGVNGICTLVLQNQREQSPALKIIKIPVSCQ